MTARNANQVAYRPRWRSPVTWMGLMAVSVVLIAACTGASGSGQGNTGGAAAGNTEASARTPLDGGEAVAPAFDLVLFGNENHRRGESISLSQFAGFPVVINFWFPSCPPCRAEMPDLQRTFEEHSDEGVQFIGVQLLGLDTAEDGQEFINKLGITYAVGADEEGKIMRAYEITSFPTTVFLDSDHRVVRKWAGILTEGKLEELVRQSLPTVDKLAG